MKRTVIQFDFKDKDDQNYWLATQLYLKNLTEMLSEPVDSSVDIQTYSYGDDEELHVSLDTTTRKRVK